MSQKGNQKARTSRSQWVTVFRWPDVPVLIRLQKDRSSKDDQVGPLLVGLRTNSHSHQTTEMKCYHDAASSSWCLSSKWQPGLGIPLYRFSRWKHGTGKVVSKHSGEKYRHNPAAKVTYYEECWDLDVQYVSTATEKPSTFRTNCSHKYEHYAIQGSSGNVRRHGGFCAVNGGLRYSFQHGIV